jgi:hypothetical protein
MSAFWTLVYWLVGFPLAVMAVCGLWLLVLFGVLNGMREWGR